MSNKKSEVVSPQSLILQNFQRSEVRRAVSLLLAIFLICIDISLHYFVSGCLGITSVR